MRARRTDIRPSSARGEAPLASPRHVEAVGGVERGEHAQRRPSARPDGQASTGLLIGEQDRPNAGRVDKPRFAKSMISRSVASCSASSICSSALSKVAMSSCCVLKVSLALERRCDGLRKERFA